MIETKPCTSEGTFDAAAWAAIAALLLLVACCEWSAPLPLEPTGGFGLAVAVAALTTAAWFYRAVRPREHFAVMCVALMQVLLFSGIGIILSYLVVRLGFPLWDARLMAWDRALGFDWFAYVHFVDRSALLSAAFHIAYASLIPQMIVLVLVMGFSKRLADLRTLMLAAIVTGSVSVLISGFMPAISYPAALGLSGADFQNVDPWAGLVHLPDFFALRDGRYTLLDFRTMQGIITFPSYHAGLSTVTMWGFARCGFRWVRWPGIMGAALTIAATPVDGGHYFVDVLAGIAIALASVGFARWAIHWTPSPKWLRALPSRRSRAAFAR